MKTKFNIHQETVIGGHRFYKKVMLPKSVVIHKFGKGSSNGHYFVWASTFEKATAGLADSEKDFFAKNYVGYELQTEVPDFYFNAINGLKNGEVKGGAFISNFGLIGSREDVIEAIRHQWERDSFLSLIEERTGIQISESEIYD